MVRPFPCVKTHVGLQMVVPREPFVTFRALERFFPGVGTFMVLQNVLVPEGAIADSARELFISIRSVFVSPGARRRRGTGRGR